MNTVKIERLDDLRNNINDIDSEIIQLLCKRFEISKNIGLIKANYGIKILDSNREEEVRKFWVTKSSEELNLLPVLESILYVSKQVQAKI